MKRRNTLALLASGALASTLMATTAQAAWPDKPITLVVPYAPGGTADALSRLIAQHLGASGMIGDASAAIIAGEVNTAFFNLPAVTGHVKNWHPFR